MALMAVKTIINQGREKSRFGSRLRAPLAFLMKLLVQPACPVCYAPVGDDDGLCAACWLDVDFITGPVCRMTGLPIPFDLGDETISPLARANPPPYDKARAAFAYKGSGAALVKRMKFGDRPELAQILARLIYSRTGDVLPRHALLVPVPLHRRRLVWRRFNQSAEICRHLAALTGQSMALQAIARIRPTPRQIGLTRAGRKRNLRGAFAVPENQKHRLKGRAVVIVDDVLTTGATVEAMARILRRAGAAPIYVVTAARVVLPERV
jgi:ComF family protein